MPWIMKMCLWILLAGTCLSLARDPAAADAAPDRGSVEVLKRRLVMRQERLDEMTAEIRHLSEKTDRKIGELLTLLAGLKDAGEARNRIFQLRVEAIGGLKRLIEIYRDERHGAIAGIYDEPEMKSHPLWTDLDLIDKQIGKRKAEIAKLVESMPGGENVGKYENDSQAYFSGIYYENNRISDVWRQNRLDRETAEKLRLETKAALERAILEIRRRADGVRNAALQSKGVSFVEKGMMEQDLALLNSLLTQRRVQLAEVMVPLNAAEDSASKDEADDLKCLLADVRRDLADDVSKIMRLYREAMGECERIKDLRETLAVREKSLKEDAPAEKK